ncbi:uncharacterized protein METZ01_LOCUS96012 [marine metagenome]|uniref:Uncharacterized protein n=1 Tax=marine metagenome TaxID=408172 RepID=A0A381VTQ9_9ZZZZ
MMVLQFITKFWIGLRGLMKRKAGLIIVNFLSQNPESARGLISTEKMKQFLYLLVK